MNQINLGKSRYGDERFLNEVIKGKWSTSGFSKIQYIRVSPIEGEPESYLFIDLDGGPFLQVENRLPNGEIIKKIKYEDGRYVLITDKFEE